MFEDRGLNKINRLIGDRIDHVSPLLRYSITGSQRSWKECISEKSGVAKPLDER